MLADSTKARFDLVTPAPGFESVAPELTALVANPVAGSVPSSSTRFTHEAIVAAVTRNASAACCFDQPPAAFRTVDRPASRIDRGILR